jgi:ribosomal protein L25 (general stress protein Ctc)
MLQATLMPYKPTLRKNLQKSISFRLEMIRKEKKILVQMMERSKFTDYLIHIVYLIRVYHF